MTNYSSSITYGKESISFNVLYVDRKTLEIAVHPDAQAIVKAPKDATPKAIQCRMVRRARWILKQINYFRKFEPRTPSRCYVSGETHLFLGRHYRLKIKKQKENAVKLKGAYFSVMTPDPNCTKKIKDLLEDWYKGYAYLVFARRLEICYETAKKLHVPFPEIQLRRMTKR